MKNKNLLLFLSGTFILLIAYFNDESPSDTYRFFIKKEAVSDNEWQQFVKHAAFLSNNIAEDDYLQYVSLQRNEKAVDTPGAIKIDDDLDLECFKHYDYDFESCLREYFEDRKRVSLESYEPLLSQYYELKSLNSPNITPHIFFSESNPEKPLDFEMLEFPGLQKSYVFWLLSKLKSQQLSCDSKLIDSMVKNLEIIQNTKHLLLNVYYFNELRRLTDTLSFLIREKMVVFNCDRLTLDEKSAEVAAENAIIGEFRRNLRMLNYVFNTDFKQEVGVPYYFLFKPQKTLNHAANNFAKAINHTELQTYEYSPIQDWNNYTGYVLHKISAPMFLNLKLDYKELSTRLELIHLLNRYATCRRTQVGVSEHANCSQIIELYKTQGSGQFRIDEVQKKLIIESDEVTVDISFDIVI